MRTRRGTPAAAITVALVAGLAAASSPAQAADVRMSTNRFADYLPSWSFVTLQGAPGEQNVVTITREDRTFVIADSGAPLRSSDGSCAVSADGGSARCTVPEQLTGIDVELRDGDDRLTNDVAPGGPGNFDAPGTGYAIDGGPGDDVLTGSGLPDVLAGGAGNDRLSGRGGPDNLTDEALDDVHGANAGGTNVFSGGEGDDRLGGSGDDTIDGGSGTDRLSLGGGAVAAAGGDGDDHFFSGLGGSHTLKGEDGDDTFVRRGDHAAPERSSVAIEGGPGRDLVEYDFWEGSKYTSRPSPDDVGATIRLSSTETTTGNGLPGQSDALTGVEDATGSVGRDVLVGSDAGNRLAGRSGSDTVRGGAGVDVLAGGTGGDAIDALDGEVDTVTCADGPHRDEGDSVRSDATDAVTGCAEAPAPPEPPEPPDTTAPDLSGTRVPRTITLRRLRTRGLTVRLRSGDASAVRATATLSTRRNRRLVRRTRSFSGRAAVTLRPRRSKARRGSLRLVLRVSDAAGNAATLRRTVRVR